MSDLNTELNNIAMDADNDKPKGRYRIASSSLEGSQLSTSYDKLIKEKDATQEALIYWIEQHNKLIIELYTSYRLIKKYVTLNDTVKLVKEMKKADTMWRGSKFCGTVLPYKHSTCGCNFDEFGNDEMCDKHRLAFLEEQ